MTAKTSNVELEIPRALKPTARMARTTKGLSVRKSKTNATTNVEAAVSKGKEKRLFRTKI